jgi:ectoine hydroxylase-related dioxygenase (phytanoyl-CoA dioxygenase family)
MGMTSRSIEERIEQYRVQGYTIFEKLYDEATMQAWRQEQDRLESVSVGPYAKQPTIWFGNMLERAPHLMWPAVSHPDILDFMEAVFGPLVQLDNLTLAAFPTMSNEEAAGNVSGWHRDRWGRMPNGMYERPLAMNAICYLQDLDDAYGPLRIIPDSHIKPVAIHEDAIRQPHADEELVYLRAGDVILTHNGLLHSGTPNTSGKKRNFFSVYYNISWLKYTDTFDGPNCRQLIAWARSRQDHRALRLLGIDEHLQARGNSGFQEPDEQRWRQWSAADREALVEEEET